MAYSYIYIFFSYCLSHIWNVHDTSTVPGSPLSTLANETTFYMDFLRRKGPLTFQDTWHLNWVCYLAKICSLKPYTEVLNKLKDDVPMRLYPPFLLFHWKPTLSCHSLQKTLNSVTYSTPEVGPTSHAPLLGPGLIRKVSLASPLLFPSKDENKICFEWNAVYSWTCTGQCFSVILTFDFNWPLTLMRTKYVCEMMYIPDHTEPCFFYSWPWYFTSIDLLPYYNENKICWWNAVRTPSN